MLNASILLVFYSGAVFLLSVTRDFYIVKGYLEAGQAAALIGFLITLNYSSSIFTDYLVNNAARFRTRQHVMLLLAATIVFLTLRSETALITAFVLCSLSTAQVCGEQIVKGRYTFSQMIVCAELIITIGVLLFIRSELTAPLVVGLRLALAYAIFLTYRTGASSPSAGMGPMKIDPLLLVCNSLFLASLVWANKVFYAEAINTSEIIIGRSVNYLLGFCTIFFNIIADKLMITRQSYLPVVAAGTVVAVVIVAHESALIGTRGMFMATSFWAVIGIFTVRILSRAKSGKFKELISQP